MKKKVGEVGMRLIDADELLEHVGRDKLDSRELIMQMVENAPTIKTILCKGRKINSNKNNAVEWISVKDRLPDKNGKYLVVYNCFQYKDIRVLNFANNLYKVDEYIFSGDKHPGWYESDDEVGYFERTDVSYWAELPPMPDI